ncbi:hypothetical protein [Aminobacter sp. Piv2-1]|uniref:hypothetical protein n=1 Tax=Aminobacter sp. Piv2-1 TaxID=3031122 RepID=UPI0030A1F969
MSDQKSVVLIRNIFAAPSHLTKKLWQNMLLESHIRDCRAKLAERLKIVTFLARASIKWHEAANLNAISSLIDVSS